jgi:hypothetical protein
MANIPRPTFVNSGKPWTKGDVTDLKDRVERGYMPDLAAKFLCRTVEEVRLKIADLGLDIQPSRPFFN